MERITILDKSKKKSGNIKIRFRLRDGREVDRCRYSSTSQAIYRGWNIETPRLSIRPGTVDCDNGTERCDARGLPCYEGEWPYAYIRGADKGSGAYFDRKRQFCQEIPTNSGKKDGKRFLRMDCRTI